MNTWHEYVTLTYHPQKRKPLTMREFSVQEIETYATRAQASAALVAAINALEGLVGLDIFSSEEQDSLKDIYNAIMEVATANDARLRVTEETLRKFQTVKPSQKALVNLISLLEDLKHESETDSKPAAPMQEGTID